MHPWPVRGPANQGELSAGGNTPSMPMFLAIRGHLTNFLGIYSTLIMLCQFSLGIFGIFKDLTRDRIPWCTNFLGIHGILTDFVKFCLG